MKTLEKAALAAIIISSALAVPCHAAPPKGGMKMPDFTKGDPIPAGATHDWTLGATGLRGWMYCDKLETSDARQISITKVEKGSPSDGILEVGDVILGVGGKPFSYDPRTEFGKALTAAEAKDGNLSLTRWRAGKQEDITVKLPVLGAYSATAPYDCPKSKAILAQGCKALAARTSTPGYERQNPIPRSLNALALLASGDPAYLPVVKKEVEWASNFSADSMATWYYGYVITLLAEYHMATGDDSVLPGLRRLALEAAKGQSAVGSWGHKFATPDGRLFGYGMMNAPGVPLTTSLFLAREAGVKAPEIDLAIERSAKLLRFYIGKGSIPYGDHAPWIQNHDDNGKNGMAAVLFDLLGEDSGAEYFSRMSLASHGNERDTGHTGNFWNMTWAVPGVSRGGPQATGAWMAEFGAWSFDLARRWDGTFIHQGPPEPAGDHTRNWDATGSYLLAYAMPLKKIMLTGKRPATNPQLSAAAAKSIVNDGRGWSNKHRNEAYDALGGDELFERLASWSPVVRDRAAMALARRKDAAAVPALVKMLASTDLNARYGACTALAKLGKDSAPAVPALRECLKDKDLWLRAESAGALAKIGEPAMVALPELLTMLAKSPTPDDPRGMEQRFLSFYVFGEMLKRSSIKGVDMDLLSKAIVAGLRNQDGRARGSVSGIYEQLTYEQLKPLLPAIQEAIVTPAPSGEMFAGQVRLAGVALFAKHRIREGLPLCIDVMEIDSWGKQDRIKSCLRSIEIYGAAAKPLLPRLKQLETDLTAHGEAKSLKEHIVKIHSLIQKLESTTETVELRSIKD